MDPAQFSNPLASGENGGRRKGIEPRGKRLHPEQNIIDSQKFANSFDNSLDVRIVHIIIAVKSLRDTLSCNDPGQVVRLFSLEIIFSGEKYLAQLKNPEVFAPVVEVVTRILKQPGQQGRSHHSLLVAQGVLQPDRGQSWIAFRIAQLLDRFVRNKRVVDNLEKPSACQQIFELCARPLVRIERVWLDCRDGACNGDPVIAG